jgi:hypothetical protein
MKNIQYLLCLLAFLPTIVWSSAKDDALRLWQKRDDKASLEGAIAKFNEHLKSGEDLDTLVYLSRGHFLLADGHLTDEDEKLKTFKAAREFGEKAMKTNPAFKQKFEKEQALERSVDALTKNEAEALLWTAISLGKWAKLNGIMSSLGQKNTIIAMIERVEALDPKAFYAAVPRYWGGFYALAPGIAGGDMKKSKKNFERSMSESPEYLATKVLYAETYLVKQDSEKEFEVVLNEVLNSADGPEAIAPENRIQKKKAKELLIQKKDLF